MQYEVARSVSVRIIDLLEVVQIEGNTAQLAAVSFRLLETKLPLRGKYACRCRAGQAVECRELAKLQLIDNQLSQILQAGELIFCRAARIDVVDAQRPDSV